MVVNLPSIPWRVSEGRGSPEQVASRSCPLWDGAGLGRQSEWLPSAPAMWMSAHELTVLSLAAGNLTAQQPSCWEGSDICFKFCTGWDTFYNTQHCCKEKDDLMCVRRTFYICMLKRHPPFPNKHVSCISCYFTFHLSFRW